MAYAAEVWPELGEVRDGPTIATLHLFSQVVGKVAVALLPWRNHGWHVTLHLHPRGLRTEPLHGFAGVFELGFDLLAHALTVVDRAGTRTLPLEPMSVADFYAGAMSLLADTGHEVDIYPFPNEVSPAIAFDADATPRAYDPDSAARLLQALLEADRIFRLFRSSFLGKVSPVHFFWGSFDLAVTRFSGRPAPLHPGGNPQPARCSHAGGIQSRGLECRVLARRRDGWRADVLFLRVSAARRLCHGDDRAGGGAMGRIAG
jgi:hypothetical protein